MATTIYVGVFRPDIESFMAFLAVLIACITVLAAIFYHPAEPPQSQIDDVSKNKAHFDKAYVIAFILVAELLATALFDAVLEDDPHGLRVAMMVGMATIFVVLCWWVATGSRNCVTSGQSTRTRPRLMRAVSTKRVSAKSRGGCAAAADQPGGVAAVRAGRCAEQQVESKERERGAAERLGALRPASALQPVPHGGDAHRGGVQRDAAEERSGERAADAMVVDG